MALSESADEPVLGLVVDGPVEPLARALVRCLARRVRVRSPGRWGGGPDAALVIGPAALDRAGTLVGDRPLAVWCPSAGLEVPPRAVAVGPGVANGGQRGPGRSGPIPVPPGGRDLSGLANFSPLVRSRWRQRAGLADRWVVEAAVIDGRDRATALAVAAAVVTDGDDLALALALGAPTVTGPAGVRAVGLEPGTEVAEVVDGEQQRRAAEALAADDRVAARRSFAAARFARTHLDLAGPAQRLLAALAIDPAARGGARARVAAHLDVLGTPPVTRIRTRANRALAVLDVDTPLRPDPSGGAL